MRNDNAPEKRRESIWSKWDNNKKKKKEKKNEGEKEREKKNMKQIGGVEKFMEFRGTLVKRNIDLFPPANRGTRKTSNRCYRILFAGKTQCVLDNLIETR